jgi:hypothetical protein
MSMRGQRACVVQIIINLDFDVALGVLQSLSEIWEFCPLAFRLEKVLVPANPLTVGARLPFLLRRLS